MPNILLIDDNDEILSTNVSHFTNQGYNVITAHTGVAAIARLNEKQYDCIVLDIRLPDMDGYAICQVARSLTEAPIIFLTCMDELDDKVKGLMSGGDDYLTKPYSLKELAARVYALIRRGGMSRLPRNAEFYIDRQNRIIQTSKKNVLLSQKEFDLFMLLYENPMKVFTKEEILKRIWRGGTADSNTVVVHIMRLRRKIQFAEKYTGCIANDYGTGYHLIPPEMEDEL